MNFKKSIIILAGGLGSRYNGLKQVDGITENNAPILEYSIYDAISAGFNKVVIILNQKIPKDCIEKLKQICFNNNVEFCGIYQNISDFIPKNYDISQREKPWGTAHALLCVKDVVQESFIVLNADDFYGKAIYKQAADIIDNNLVSEDRYHIIAYPLYKPLSENGSVSRGICQLNPDKTLKQITERTQIFEDDGNIYFEENNHREVLDANTLVSMNFSIFHPSIFKTLKEYFIQFIESKPMPKEEFFIPKVIQQCIDENKASILVHKSESDWMGMTYPEDKIILKTYLENKINIGDYPKNLWS